MSPSPDDQVAQPPNQWDQSSSEKAPQFPQSPSASQHRPGWAFQTATHQPVEAPTFSSSPTLIRMPGLPVASPPTPPGMPITPPDPTTTGGGWLIVSTTNPLSPTHIAVDPAVSQIVRTPTGWLPDGTMSTTDISNGPKITRKLPPSGSATSTKLPTIIPATEKRRTSSLPPQMPRPPRHRRPIRLIAVLTSCLVMFIVATLYVTPLGNGQGQFITDVINNIFSTGSTLTNPLQHVPTPTPTQAVLTNNGYCGGTDIWGTCATAVTESGVMGSGQMQSPIKGATLTQVFANPEYQNWCACWKPHSGIDLAADYGAPILAVDSGQVIWVGWDWSGMGWAVKINHGHYIATQYGHLSRYIVKVGQNVEKGEVIAYEGSTGQSTGPHLHFMVLVNNIWVNPIQHVALP